MDPNGGSELYGISAEGSNIWMAGYEFDQKGVLQPYLARVITSSGPPFAVDNYFPPNPGASFAVNDVSAVANDNIEFVGNYSSSTLAFAEKLDALTYTYTQQAPVQPSNQINNFNGIDRVPATSNFFAVGDQLSSSSSGTKVLIENFNGTTWSSQLGTNPGSSLNILYDVESLSSGGNDVWAVGETQMGTGHLQPLAEHYDGSAWSTNSPTAVGSSDNVLSSITDANGNVYAGGYEVDSNSIEQPLIQHYC